MSFFELRNNLRIELRSQRNHLKEEEYTALNLSLQKNVEGFLNQHCLKIIMSYYPIHNEAVPVSKNWIDLFFSDKEHVFLLPRIESNDPPVISAVEGSPFSPKEGDISSWGIYEPKGKPSLETEPECILIPGLAFDPSGFRLGYGKGYYDYFLPKTSKKCLKVGICFEFQIIDDTFPQEHDYRLDYIITDKRIIKTIY